MGVIDVQVVWEAATRTYSPHGFVRTFDADGTVSDMSYFTGNLMAPNHFFQSIALMGMLLVNAYQAYKYELADGQEAKTLFKFTNSVAWGLCRTTVPSEEGVVTRSNSSGGSAAAPEAPIVPVHALFSCSDHRKGCKRGGKGHCTVCSQECHHFCMDCTEDPPHAEGLSRAPKGTVCFLCCPGRSGRHFYTTHLIAKLGK
jgi:hypothetical protein